MKKQITAIEKFHKAFKCPIRHNPTLIPIEEAVLRYDLMREENDEHMHAINTNDLVEVADALGDQLYILCGTIISHGMQDIIYE